MRDGEDGRLRLHGERGPGGDLRWTELLGGGEGTVVLWGGGEVEVRFPLPPGAVAAVFRRYGRPLDEGPTEEARRGPAIEISHGRTLRAFSFRSLGWVQPADYVALFVRGKEPLAAPAPLCAAALLALGRAASGRP